MPQLKKINLIVRQFSRDCLEVDIDVDGTTLSLYINHFKSLMGRRNQTRPRREEQAARVVEIVESWWDDYNGNFIVLGDLNDYMEGQTSLDALVNHPSLVNVVDRLPAQERWTHFYAGGNEYRQLDYLLLSRGLAQANGNVQPAVLRNGLPHRATDYTGPRYDDVGHNYPKASDHCPLAIDIDLL